MIAKGFRYPAVLLVAALAILCARPLTVRADIVVLADGRKIEGTVKREGDAYVITGRFGSATRVSVYEVADIRRTGSAFDEFGKKRDALEAKGDKATAREWFQLAAFAVEHKLTAQAREAYEKVVSIDPAHERAHRALEHVRYEGAWMTEERAMALKGMVKVGGRWVPREEARKGGQVRRERRRRRSPDPGDLAKAAGRAFAIKHEVCQKCAGSGMEIWINCGQCARSSRRGWCWYGEGFRLCPDCKGTARIPGLRCRDCRGIGKIDPNKKRTWTGRVIPSDCEACPHCNGTGGLEWQKCRQCARSSHRGVMFFGDHYEVCRKCSGTTKHCALQCYHCRGTGMLRKKR